MQKVAITGARGVIGSVISRGLQGFALTPLDLPDIDIRNYAQLRDALIGFDTVVHLAWVSTPLDEESAITHPDNFTMMQNVAKAARVTGIKHIVMASSVHAGDVSGLRLPDMRSLDATQTPNGSYGASKQFGEALGRYTATKGIMVSCIRFGAVNQSDERPIGRPFEAAVWLQHSDLIQIVQKVLSLPVVPGQFNLVPAVSTFGLLGQMATSPLQLTLETAF